ncbi:MAG: Holliday junction branch migration protein RuvA [Candidatus Peregrinibacteria bacterium]
MIAFLEGKLSALETASILINIGGVGYRVHCTKKTLQKCASKVGESVLVFTYHHIREDRNDLFGFLEKEESQFYEHLLGLSGIGPKTALEILEFPLSQIFEAVAAEEVSFLAQIKGLGKKTASRMILELKGSLPRLSAGEESSFSVFHQDIEQALLNLGFPRERVSRVMGNLPAEKNTEESALKWALKELSM